MRHNKLMPFISLRTCYEDKLFPTRFDTNKNEKSVWYLDNKASNYITGNRGFFSNLGENIKGKVKFGDGSYVDIEGKGMILFECKNGKNKVLKDIYLISKLKHNIISLGQATKGGCEIIMREYYLMLKDSNKRLLVQVKRSPNRLKTMKIAYSGCYILQDFEATWK